MTINAFLGFSAVSLHSLSLTHSPPLCLCKVPSNTGLVSGPPVGTAQTLIWFCSACSNLQCPQLLELVFFSFVEFSLFFHIFQRRRVCLAPHVIYQQLEQLMDKFSILFFSHTALWGFILPLHVGHPLGFSWGCLKYLGLSIEDWVWRLYSCLYVGTVAVQGRQGSQWP